MAEEIEKLSEFYMLETRPRPQSPSMVTYVVANPHDRPETIDLSIRPASLPPNWELFVIAADTLSDGTVPDVWEDEPGRDYRIDLPARSSVRLAIVLIPFGDLGEGTTARWAVQGWIGDELLGGIVQELIVPAEALAAQPPSGQASEESSTGWPILRIVAGLLVLAIGLAVLLVLRGRTRSSS